MPQGVLTNILSPAQQLVIEKRTDVAPLYSVVAEFSAPLSVPVQMWHCQGGDVGEKLNLALDPCFSSVWMLPWTEQSEILHQLLPWSEQMAFEQEREEVLKENSGMLHWGPDRKLPVGNQGDGDPSAPPSDHPRVTPHHVTQTGDSKIPVTGAIRNVMDQALAAPAASQHQTRLAPKRDMLPDSRCKSRTEVDKVTFNWTEEIFQKVLKIRCHEHRRLASKRDMLPDSSLIIPDPNTVADIASRCKSRTEVDKVTFNWTEEIFQEVLKIRCH